MIRYSYKTPCRFLSDSDTTADIVWFPCAEGAQDLPFASSIRPLLLKQTNEKVTFPGELQWEWTPPYFAKAAIPNSGIGHVCGTEEDFARGNPINDPRPELTYRSDGLPTCCNAPLALRGGAAGGGVSSPTLMTVTVVGGSLFCIIATSPFVPPWWQVNLFPDPAVPQWFSTATVPGVGAGFRLRAYSLDPAALAVCSVRLSACTIGTQVFSGFVPTLASGMLDMNFPPVPIDDYRVMFRSNALGVSPSVVFRFDPL
jgi:hypothetical protein